VNAAEDDFQCLICHLPLKEPVLTRCGHRFCKECLEEHFRRQEAQHQPITCPADREGLDRERVHLASCLLKLVHCTNENCPVTMQRRHLEEHVTINCTWRILECDNCSEPHPVCNMQDHFGQCSKFPVTCSNSCGASIRREMVRLLVLSFGLAYLH